MSNEPTSPPSDRPATSDADRRIEPRFAIELETSVVVAGNSGQLMGKSRNISKSGVFVYLDQELAPGTGVNVVLTDTVLGIELHARAEVVHHVAGLGIGLSFLDMETGAREDLATILQHWKDHREQTYSGRWVRTDGDKR